MVDNHLPFEDRERRLRYLFLDLNSYFASCEQQERPELRGRPVAVCPVMADSSFVIAASYEAKAFGVKCGTMIGDAKVMCPGIALVDGRHSLYSAYHRRVKEACEMVLPIDEVCSIDEMRFRLLGEEREPEAAREIALHMKRTIAREVGECMTSSIGIAPNPFLAKLGTELQKPNGLVIIEAKDLPHRLYELKLRDFTGINKRMEIRLNAAGIFTAEDLCTAPREKIREAFGSVVGERWYYLLRGFELPSEKTRQKSLGHSHVLPPELRTDQGCKEVMLRLLAKASARLRAEGFWAGDMSVSIRGKQQGWHAYTKLPPTQDSVTMTEHFLRMWEGRDFVGPMAVGVTFTDLHPAEEVTPSLFDETVSRSDFSHAMDRLNQKFGKNTIYLAAMDKVRGTASEKIAFGKTELFSEGKGDNEWVDTFRGEK